MNDKVAVEFYRLFSDQTWDTIVGMVDKDIVDSGEYRTTQWGYDNILSNGVVLIGVYGIPS